jgi:membrane-associated phospholipid phosphatase
MVAGLWLALLVAGVPVAAQQVQVPSWPPSASPDVARVETERGLVPPGLLRYGIPEPATPFVVPYVAVGAVLLVADPYLLRTFKLDWPSHRGEVPPDRQARAAWRAFSHLGDLETVVLGLVGLYALGGSRERNAARVGAVAYGNALSLSAVGKYLIGKERPEGDGGRLRYHGPNRRHASFPSAHASGTASMARVLAHYYPDARPLWYGLSGMAGVSRVGLGRHWPSDVWWGWGVGIISAEGPLRERERIEAWRPW